MTDFGAMRFLMLAGSLGLLIYGMKLMSESLQQVAGRRMHRVIRAMTAERLRGALTGLSATLVVQYSSVVSVMVVSFVNSGLISLRKAVPVLIGTNIGTTVKLLLFAAIGFSGTDLNLIAGPLLAAALPLLLVRDHRAKAASHLLVGAALLFLAFSLLKANVPLPNADTLGFLASMHGRGLPSHLAFAGIGMLLALFIQSSSVAMVLTLALCTAGTLDYAAGAALVLGENIGTTFTANFAALGGNAWAKRAARAHLLIKLIGAAWALALFQPILLGVAAITRHWNGGDPYTDPWVLKWSLAYFHFGFNLVNGLVLLNFIPWIERAVIRLVPARGRPEEEFRLAYIEDPLTAITPELSLMEARKEVAKLCGLDRRMLGMVRALLLESDAGARAHVLRRLAKYGAITDRVEAEVGQFLARAGAEVRDGATGSRIQAMLSMTRELEQAGNVLVHMGKALERKADQRLWFTPGQRGELLEYIGRLDQTFRALQEKLEAGPGATGPKSAGADGPQRREPAPPEEDGRGQDVRAGLAFADLMRGCRAMEAHLRKAGQALGKDA